MASSVSRLSRPLWSPFEYFLGETMTDGRKQALGFQLLSLTKK